MRSKDITVPESEKKYRAVREENDERPETEVVEDNKGAGYDDTLQERSDETITRS